MRSIQKLLESFWILKSRDKDMYFCAKSELNSIEKFAKEFTGWRVISNERIIKLEKVPSYAQSFMGITTFQSKLDYMILCAMLIYLEDKEDNEEFLLSEIVENIEVQLKDFYSVDWTRFTDRKSLIRVMQYVVDMDLLICHEGNIDEFAIDSQKEVLYENTGLSRYFAVNFVKDVSAYKSYEDFEKINDDMDTDRGSFRKNRVYRRLSTSPAVYWDDTDDSDSIYLKNQRGSVEKYLNEYLGGRLDIHKNSAYFMLEDSNNYGEAFPKDSTLCDIAVLFCTIIRNHKELSHNDNDTTFLSKSKFIGLVDECRNLYSFVWSKEYRELSTEKIAQRLCGFMESWMLLKQTETGVILYPGVYKFLGIYPVDITDEKQNGNKTNNSSDIKTDEGIIKNDLQLSLF